jgi:cobalt/nickel transport system permease protein
VTPRAWLGAWGLAVVAATLVHDPAWLAGALAAVLLLSGAGRLALLAQATRIVAPVLLLVSAGYLAMGWWTDSLSWAYLLRLNLRVVLLAALTAWVVRDVDLDHALQGWPAAQRWLCIVRGQVTVFRRLAGEYRAAVQSRSTVPPSLGQRYRAGAALGLAALDKAVYNSEAVTQAMRSRGALDD